MKITLLSTMLFLMLIGCNQTQEQILMKDGETYLIAHLNDPSSYQKISQVITDTFTVCQLKNQLWETDSFLCAVSTPNDLPEKIKEHKKEMLACNVNDIRSITVEYQYRAKNKFGAVTLQKTLLTYGVPNKKYPSWHTGWEIAQD